MGLLTESLYSPEELARAYAVRGSDLVLLADHTEGLAAWERTRQLVYEFVYGEVNLSAGMILFRALDFARREGEIKRDYFLMTDSEAFNYLLTRCNSRTRELMERANRWIFYPRVFNLREDDVSEKFINYVMDSDNKGQLADEISLRLKIPPEDVSVYMGKDKGFKKIHLPIVGNDRDQEHQPQRKLAYMLQVYVHPKWADRTTEAEEIAKDKLN